jgi:hypothetical protein
MRNMIELVMLLRGPVRLPATSNLRLKNSGKVGTSGGPEIRAGWIKGYANTDSISSGLLNNC